MSVSNSRILSVIKREVRIRLGRSFVIGTLMIPLVMAAIVGIQIGLSNMKSQDPASVTIALEEPGRFEEVLKQAVSNAEFMESKLYTVTYRQVDSDDLEAFLEEQKAGLLDDDNKSVFFIPASAMEDKKIAFYSANPANTDVRTKFGAAISKALNENYFAANDIRGVNMSFVQTDVSIIGKKVSSSGTQTESWGPVIIGGVLALLLNLGISFNAMPLMNVVVGEKANRLYEVLLTSLRPRDILWGKVIGATIIATLQMLIWVTAFVLLALVMDNFGDVSSALRIDFQPFVIAYYLVNYVVGLLIFLSLYAGLSSMYDNQGAASSAMAPIFFLLLLPMYTTFALVSNPANTVATILSITPFTSLYVMPARMSLIDVPLWQSLLALALNVGVLYVAIGLAGKVYRVSVLATGNNPSLRQIISWARAN